MTEHAKPPEPPFRLPPLQRADMGGACRVTSPSAVLRQVPITTGPVADRRCPVTGQIPDEWKPYTPGRRWRQPHLGIKAEGFRWGHRMGRTDACRRLWQHLSPEGRQLATAIATEGDDADD